jgi:hypothetical protein
MAPSKYKSSNEQLKFHPPFFLFLAWKSGSPDTILEGAIQEPFHQSLVAIGPVVSEEKIKM